jgi:hypothetical protein
VILLLDIVTVAYGLTLYRLPKRKDRVHRLAVRKVQSERVWAFYKWFRP